MKPRNIAFIFRSERFVSEKARHMHYIGQRAALIATSRGHHVTCLHVGPSPLPLPPVGDDGADDVVNTLTSQYRSSSSARRHAALREWYATAVTVAAQASAARRAQEPLAFSLDTEDAASAAGAAAVKDWTKGTGGPAAVYSRIEPVSAATTATTSTLSSGRGGAHSTVFRLLEHDDDGLHAKFFQDLKVGTMEHISIPPPPVGGDDTSRDWFQTMLGHLPPIMHACVDCTGPYCGEEHGDTDTINKNSKKKSVVASNGQGGGGDDTVLSPRAIFEQELVAGGDCTAAAVAFHAAQLTQLTRLATATERASSSPSEVASNASTPSPGGDNDVFQNMSRPEVASCWFLSDWRLLKTHKKALNPLLLSPALDGMKYTVPHQDLIVEMRKEEQQEEQKTTMKQHENADNNKEEEKAVLKSSDGGAVVSKRRASPPRSLSIEAIESYSALTSPAARAAAAADHYSNIVSARMRDFSVLCIPPLLHKNHQTDGNQHRKKEAGSTTRSKQQQQPFDDGSHYYDDARLVTGGEDDDNCNSSSSSSQRSTDRSNKNMSLGWTDMEGLVLAVNSPVMSVTAYTDIVKVPLPTYIGGFSREDTWGKEYRDDQICEATMRHLPTAAEFAWFLADRVGPSLSWLQTADDDLRQRERVYFGHGDTRTQQEKEIGFKNPSEGAAPAALTQFLDENTKYTRKLVGLYAGYRAPGDNTLRPRWPPSRSKHLEQGFQMPGLQAMVKAYHSSWGGI